VRQEGRNNVTRVDSRLNRHSLSELADVAPQRAVIYVRVSSKEQVEGYSLDTQEKTCRDFAERNGYCVDRVFRELGESAKTTDRTELQAMITYVGINPKRLSALIVYKVDRLARITLDYATLKSLFSKYGLRLLSATETLEDNPAGRFAETTLAAIAQFDNEIRAERCKNGMIAAVSAGRFVWPAPIGYHNGQKREPSLVPESSSVIKLLSKAWRLVDEGMSPCEARETLAAEGLRNHKGHVLSKHAFRDMLTNEVYLGYINAFGMRVRGDFEPLVDAELFRRVQTLLAPTHRSDVRPYRMTNPDFPLRGMALCPRCGRPLTAAWSRGHGGTYGYYRCMRCSRVAFRKDSVESRFVKHLNELSLKPAVVDLLGKAIEANLEGGLRSNREAVHQLESRLEEQLRRKNVIIEKSLKNVLPDNAVRGLIEETERTIEGLKAEKQHLLEGHIIDCDTARTGIALLKEMGSLWKESDISIQKRLQRFVFPDGTSFDGSQFGTTALPACLQIKEDFILSGTSLVRPTGFEPVIYGSGGHCLIQLGHGRARRQV